MAKYKYALQRLEPYPFKIRHELRKNMTNLPERWTEIMFSNNLDLLTKYIDKTHRIINWNTLEIIVGNEY